MQANHKAKKVERTISQDKEVIVKSIGQKDLGKTLEKPLGLVLLCYLLYHKELGFNVNTQLNLSDKKEIVKYGEIKVKLSIKSSSIIIESK